MSNAPTEKEVNAFILGISEPRFEGMFNPWSDQSATELHPGGAFARRKRLQLHLSCPNPKIVLIGEAAGYQGCKFSGIPFTSERLILEGRIPRVPQLDTRISIRNRPWSEPSATIVWKTLDDLNLAEHTIMSNAVPWHPVGERGPLSNRTPRCDEIEAGRSHLKHFLSLFPNLSVVALGKIASDSLEALGVDHRRVRHPAYGGALKFREGLRHLVDCKRSNTKNRK